MTTVFTAASTEVATKAEVSDSTTFMSYSTIHNIHLQEQPVHGTTRAPCVII